MKLTIVGGGLKVEREKGDPRYSKSQGGYGNDPEGTLLYHIKNTLNALGCNLIKKRMWRDGHLVSETQQYLRPSSSKSLGPHVYIYNGEYAIRDQAATLMERGYCYFTIEDDVYETGEDSLAMLREMLGQQPVQKPAGNMIDRPEQQLIVDS